eukprot:25634_1
MSQLWLMLSLWLVNGYTPQPSMYPTSNRVQNPCRINTCAECASQWNCVWCNNTCIIDGEICYNSDHPITQEFACPDYQPITEAYFSENYLYQYNVFINMCQGTYNITNATDASNTASEQYLDEIISTIDFNEDCQHSTYELTIWIDLGDNITSRYQLYGQVNNLQRSPTNLNTTSSINEVLNQNESIFITEPPCAIFINEGVVNQIECPKNGLNHNFSTFAVPQQDILFTTLRYLLPRLEITLFHKNDGIISEVEQNGVAKMKRNAIFNLTDDNGNNCTLIQKEYRQKDFDEYYGHKLKDRKVTYTTMIDSATKDISTVTFDNAFILAELKEMLLWSFSRYTLRNINTQIIEENVVDKIEYDVYVNSLKQGYQMVTYNFSMDEWRGMDPTQPKTETHEFTNKTAQNLKENWQSTQQKLQEQEESTRRRLQDPIPIDPTIILDIA